MSALAYGLGTSIISSIPIPAYSSDWHKMIWANEKSFWKPLGSFINSSASSFGGAGGGLVGAISSSKSDGSGQSFHVDRNGVHRPVWQYENYQSRISNGTAPSWMKTAYSRWSNAINIHPIPKGSPCNEYFSSSTQVNLGKYKQGMWESFGYVPYDANINLHLGSETSFNFNLNTFDKYTANRKGNFSSVNRALFNASGILDNVFCGPDSSGFGFWFRFTVTH